jgi:hypothetical protein
MLRARWQQLWVGWRAWRRSQQWLGPDQTLAPGAGEAGKRRWWPLRWGGLSPDQQVRYLYFQLLDRAAESDKPRLESETPAAFAPRLSNELEAEEPDKEAIEALTAAFERVRYAGESAQSEQVSWLQQLWDRLRRSFTSQP